MKKEDSGKDEKKERKKTQIKVRKRKIKKQVKVKRKGKGKEKAGTQFPVRSLERAGVPCKAETEGGTWDKCEKESEKKNKKAIWNSFCESGHTKNENSVPAYHLYIAVIPCVFSCQRE